VHTSMQRTTTKRTVCANKAVLRYYCALVTNCLSLLLSATMVMVNLQQIIQKNALLKYKYLVQFISDNAPETAEEVNKLSSSYFKPLLITASLHT
jgi:hypothetical protein